MGSVPDETIRPHPAEPDRRPVDPDELRDWLRSTEHDMAEWQRDRREFDRAEWVRDNQLPEDRGY